MIIWHGKSTNGLLKWNCKADSFMELYKKLCEKDVISNVDYDVYDRAVLEKFDKTEEDEEFQNADGDLDYEKVQEFVETHDLTDEELWIVIAQENGNAYYQTFERDNGDEIVEIGVFDFDQNGKYKY